MMERKCGFSVDGLPCSVEPTLYVGDRNADGWACWACETHGEDVIASGWIIFDRVQEVRRDGPETAEGGLLGQQPY